MDGDYAEQVQFVDHDLDAINGEEDEDEYEQQPQPQRKRGVEIESFDSVGDSAGNGIKGPVDQPRRDFSEGKLFVGGISWETTEETFSKYFSKYGEIEDSVIMMDKLSGRPRGFGFVTFVDLSVVDKVLEKDHVIDGRAVEVKRTVPREDAPVRGILKTKKIFVGGIPPSLSEDEFREYFSTYGNIIEHQIMLDHQTGRSRGFGFVTFETEDPVELIFSKGKTHELGGKQVEIKKAEPKRALDNNGSARSYGGSRESTASYGGGYSAGGGYSGKDRGYGGYGPCSGLGGYGNYGGGSYGGVSAGFYGGYGGYGYGFGYGEPMYGGNAGYGGSGYGISGAYGGVGGYGASAGYGGGKGYGSGRYGSGDDEYESTGGGYGSGGRGGYGSRGAGYGNGGGGGGGRAGGGYGSDRGYGDTGAGHDAARYHPYQR